MSTPSRPCIAALQGFFLDHRTVALTQNGQAWAWGALRTWDTSAPPMPNTATPFALVAESHAHTLAVCRAGQAWFCHPLVDPLKGSARQLPTTIQQGFPTAASAPRGERWQPFFMEFDKNRAPALVHQALKAIKTRAALPLNVAVAG